MSQSPAFDSAAVAQTLYLTQATVSAILAAVLGGLFAVYRRPFLLHWCASFGALALWHLCPFAASASESTSTLVASAGAVLGCLHVALLLSGAWSLMQGRRITLAGWALILGAPLLLGAGSVLATGSAAPGLRALVRTGLMPLCSGIALLITAMVVARLARKEALLARWLVVLFLALGGLANLWLFESGTGREGRALAGLSQLFVPHFVLLFLRLMLVFSLLLWFFEDERRALLQATRELSQKEEHLRRSEHLEAVGRLAGGVAHDFNNLLTAITGHAELLLARHPGNDPDRDDLVPIARASSRAASLVRELLTFSRRMPVRPRHFAPDRMLAEMRHMLARLLGESVPLELALGAPGATVYADPPQIELLILNLVTNGREAMLAGGHLRVATRVRRLAAPELAGLEPGEYFELEVSDDGCGIPPEALGKIFEPFFTTKQGKGTGLGLASVYGVARTSGGDVRVESQVGRGATFRVFLPLATLPPESEVELAPAPPSRGGAETILLVEDELQVRELAQRILTRAGYRVLAAERGEVALELAQGTQLDLVVSDVILPGLGARELTHALRLARPALPVLLMSGYSEAHLRSVGIEGEAPFLAKPFSNQALLAAVRATLEGRTPTLAGAAR